MPGRDPTHWLHRLDAPEWLAAARHEARAAAEALARRAVRPAVTHARRAAGMACNAVLVGRTDERWGRSYMEHVVALADEPAAPETVRAAARTLVETRPVPPELVRLGLPDPAVLDAARAIIGWAAAQLSVNG